MAHSVRIAFGSFLALMLYALPTSLQADPLVINISSYHQGYSWSDDTTAGIRSALFQEFRVETLYLDTKRLPKSEHEESASQVFAEALKREPDLILLGDDNALRLLAPKLLTQAIPVVFYGINANPRHYFPKQQRPANMTGILERVPVIPLLRTLIELLPEARSILVLSDGSISGMGQLETQLYGRKTISIGPITAKYVDSPEWNHWQETVLRAHQDHDAIALIGFHAVHDASNPVDYLFNLKWTAKHAKIPIFTIQKHVGADLAVGAVIIDGFEHGRHAGQIARTALTTGKLTTIPVDEDRSTKLILSTQALERHSIRPPKALLEHATLLP